jgi:4-amino-4-deoxy-L-arabinose transferase-like glycosyltransferase
MFLDGVTYASIARNLAQGRGQFWAPHYTDTIYPAFHEHPPLAFWLQSLWFRAFGDHWFVERAYSATAAVLIALFIVITWRAVHSMPDGRNQDWLPVALWMAAPVVSWTIVGNLLETTVSVFVTAAVAVLTLGLRDFSAFAKASADRRSFSGGGSSGPPRPPWWDRYRWGALPGRPGSVPVLIACGCLSGLGVVGATLAKGPVGLFPLATPFILALLPERRWRSTWCGAAAQWTIVILCGALLYLGGDSRESLSRYLREQVVSALAGRRETSAGPWTMVGALVEGVWLPMALFSGMLVVMARRWTIAPSRERSVAVAFTLLGLCGTLPILLSPKQTGHYLMPAVPFYAIGAGAFVAPTAADLLNRLRARRSAVALRVLAATVVAGAGVAAALPAFEREPARLAELDRLAAVAPRGATVGICPSTNGDWGLHAWFQRRFQMSLDAADPVSHEWFLQTGEAMCAPVTCRAVSDPSARLVLLRCAQ